VDPATSPTALDGDKKSASSRAWL